MSELAPESTDHIKEAYKHRYGGTTEQLPADYPYFPSVGDIEQAIRAQTEFPLATAEPYDTYPSVEETPVMFQGSLEPAIVRRAFTGSNEELEEALQVCLNSSFGIQITDPRLTLPEDVVSALVAEAQETAIKRQTQSTAVNGTWWLNKAWKVDEDIAEGRLTEGYEFTFGDNSIQLYNLDSPLQPEVVENIRVVLERITHATDGRLFSVLNTVLLQHADRMPHSLGEAFGSTGVFRINSALYELEHRLKNVKTDQNIEGYTFYQKTIAHEIGHLFDVNDMVGHKTISRLKDLGDGGNTKVQYRSSFGPLLGWVHNTQTITDAEGKETQHTIKGVGSPPARTLVMQGGRPVQVDTVEYFGQETIDQAAPLTAYGNTNESEDFAEAFARYVLAGEGAVEPLRREGLRLTIGSLIEIEPVPIPEAAAMIVSKVALSDIKPKIVVPKSKPLSVFIESRWSKAPAWMTIGSSASS